MCCSHTSLTYNTYINKVTSTSIPSSWSGPAPRTADTASPLSPTCIPRHHLCGRTRYLSLKYPDDPYITTPLNLRSRIGSGYCLVWLNTPGRSMACSKAGLR